MLKEWEGVRQRPEEGTRRWFTDSDFDLIVWYKSDELVGFQLCYDKQSTERALTWYRTGGYSHAKVDTGEGPVAAKRTAMLVSDGEFDADRVLQDFLKSSQDIDPEIVAIVREALERYPG